MVNRYFGSGLSDLFTTCGRWDLTIMTTSPKHSDVANITIVTDKIIDNDLVNDDEDFQQELPPHWRQLFDPNTERYFFANLQTGVTQWEAPDVNEPITTVVKPVERPKECRLTTAVRLM